MTSKTGLLRKVDCVLLYVDDLDAGLAFYRDRFGHELIWRTDHQVGLRMPETDAELVLQNKERYYETDILVDSADDAAAQFVAAGGKIVEAAVDIAVGRVAVVEDPWGNQLVLLDLSKGPHKTDKDGNVI
jgi:predicted enzyme related to lactoylglutathione lyase